MHDYKVECDFRINTESIYTAGFILHGARYSNSAYETEDYRYIQGYYIALNKRMVKVEKLNYTHTDSGCRRGTAFSGHRQMASRGDHGERQHGQSGSSPTRRAFPKR